MRLRIPPGAVDERRRGPGRPRKRGRARSPAGKPAARRQHGSEDAVNLPVDSASAGSFKRCNGPSYPSTSGSLIRQLAIAAPHEALADVLIATLKSTQPMPETGAQPSPDLDPKRVAPHLAGLDLLVFDQSGLGDAAAELLPKTPPHVGVCLVGGDRPLTRSAQGDRLVVGSRG